MSMITLFKDNFSKEQFYKCCINENERKALGINYTQDLFNEVTQELKESITNKLNNRHEIVKLASNLSENNLDYCIFQDSREFPAYPGLELYSNKGNFKLTIYEKHFYIISEASGIFNSLNITSDEERTLTILNGYSDCLDVSYDFMLNIKNLPSKTERKNFLDTHNIRPKQHTFSKKDNVTLEKYFNIMEKYNDMIGKCPVSENKLIENNFDIIVGTSF